MAGVTGAIIIGGAMLATSYYSNKQAGESMDDANYWAGQNMDLQNKIAEEQLKFQKEEAAKLEKQKDIYRDMEFTNPYADVTNPYANLQTQYENVYEDLTVNTLQAEFQAQQGAQQRADIMEGMRGAAGSSGIASLAQAMANQGQLQTQQISASIGQQEMAVQQMRARGAAGVQAMEAGREQLIAQGEGVAEMTKLGGEAALQEMEMSRQATLLGIQMGQTSGANAALQQAYANQMSAMANQANLYGQQAAAQYGMAGDALQAAGNFAGMYYGGGS